MILEKAIDALQACAHKGLGAYKYKIAAVLFDAERGEVFHATSNDLPDAFRDVFQPQDPIGDSGATIHAESLLLVTAPVPTKDKSILVSDPLCPNCMKAVIAAGIANVFVMEGGFKSLWYTTQDEAGIDRAQYYSDVSLEMARLAGIDVYEIDLESKSKKNISNINRIDQKPYINFESVKGISLNFQNNPYAIVKVDENVIVVKEHYTAGMNDAVAEAIRAKFAPHVLRYRLMVDPLTAVQMAAAYEGISLKGRSVFISEIPTSRCIVNAIGAGITALKIAPTPIESEKSKIAAQALDMLQDKGILDVEYNADISEFLDIEQ